eukprot:12409497-Karenia_brevis.AAC.1
MSPEELRLSNGLPKEALPLIGMISVIAKHAQQMEDQREIQRGVLSQHQLMITKIEEAINESAIRINGFLGDSFTLS